MWKQNPIGSNKACFFQKQKDVIEKDFGPDGVLRALITLHYLLERQILNFVDLFQKDWHLSEVVSLFHIVFYIDTYSLK